MPRRRHPKKEVEAALTELEAFGWRVIERHGKTHAWGIVRCPYNDPDCRCGEFCQMTVNSTPRDPARHAAKLVSKALNCIILNREGRHDDEL